MYNQTFVGKRRGGKITGDKDKGNYTTTLSIYRAHTTHNTQHTTQMKMERYTWRKADIKPSEKCVLSIEWNVSDFDVREKYANRNKIDESQILACAVYH